MGPKVHSPSQSFSSMFLRQQEGKPLNYCTTCSCTGRGEGCRECAHCLRFIAGLCRRLDARAKALAIVFGGVGYMLSTCKESPGCSIA